MKQSYIEVYQFFKKEKSNSLLLFRIGNNYEAYFEDAVTISKTCPNGYVLSGKDEITKVYFKENKLMYIMSFLSFAHIKCSTIEIRDKNGKFSLPNVKQISRDVEEDY